MSSTKRQRTGEAIIVTTPARRSRRPIDKNIIVISKTAISATQQTTTLFTATFPCTVTGLRWDISAVTGAGTAPGNFVWAIVKVQQGDAANALAVSDAATMYAPEQNVLVWGFANVVAEDTIGQAATWRSSTKIMRKLLGGDLLVFICKGEATNTTDARGAVQFFCMT